MYVYVNVRELLPIELKDLQLLSLVRRGICVYVWENQFTITKSIHDNYFLSHAYGVWSCAIYLSSFPESWVQNAGPPLLYHLHKARQAVCK